MNEVNKTLYIPLYGKALVSRKGLILHDPKAEAIWEAEGFVLKGKSASKWLAYYMGMRAAVFDDWVRRQLLQHADAVVLQIGCGLDSRIERIGNQGHLWYDLDFPAVIDERRKHYQETGTYRMLSGDAKNPDWLSQLPSASHAIVVLEGVGMYLRQEELQWLLKALSEYFPSLSLLIDCYTEFAAKASRYKNPVNEVGVTTLYGLDDPALLQTEKLRFYCEHELTPSHLIEELQGFERWFFRRAMSGRMAHKLYQLFEYAK